MGERKVSKSIPHDYAKLISGFIQDELADFIDYLDSVYGEDAESVAEKIIQYLE